MNREETEFVIYIINEVANMLDKYPSNVYKAMNKTGCIRDYLVPLYDILHTMNSRIVASDVLKYVESRGVSI
ncbi:MAG: DUF3791 domain-containing protein [Ruminococcus sp.]|nr:DUF3791 domain-containing protein [Ruminococcus sp.]